MTTKPSGDSEIVLYPGPSGPVSFALNAKEDTIWGTWSEIANAFGCTERNARQHIENVYSEGELDREGTLKKVFKVQTEGGRSVKREVSYFNLDVIISVGYRVNSPTLSSGNGQPAH